MNRSRSRWSLLGVVACVAACATARVQQEKSSLGTTGIQPPPSLMPQPASTPPHQASATAPATTFEGRSIATELPPEVKRLIDGVRRLHETPGLILDREAIYKTLDVKPTSLFAPPRVSGRTMTEELGFERSPAYANWRGSLKYFEFPESGSWSVIVELRYGNGPNCYPSRLVESYWGKPFVYRPLGVHAFRRELQRKQRDLLPTGPHDGGSPFNAEFSPPHVNSASVIFYVGPGSCLVSVTAGRLFKSKEYGDDQIYRQ